MGISASILSLLDLSEAFDILTIVSFSAIVGFGARQCSLALMWLLCPRLVPVSVDRDSEVHPKAALLWYAIGLGTLSAPF